MEYQPPRAARSSCSEVAGQLGLDQLAGDVEGLALLLFPAAGGEDGAGAGVGAAAQFGEQGGLAEAGRAGEGEQRAAACRARDR